MLSNFKDLSANARHGVVALVLGAIGLGATIWIDGAAPMHLLWMAVLVFGQLAYGQEAGFEKPLTKLVLVALMFGVFGFTLYIVEGSAKGGLLFSFGAFFSIFFWAVAMLHRPGPARQAGKAGAAVGAVSITVLIGGHVFVGLGAAFGLGALRSAATASAEDVKGLVQIACLCLGLWSLACVWLVVKGHLQAPDAIAD